MSKKYGVYGEQDWRGETYMGLSRSTIVIDAEGRLRGILRGLRPNDYAAAALKLLKTIKS